MTQKIFRKIKETTGEVLAGVSTPSKPSKLSKPSKPSKPPKLSLKPSQPGFTIVELLVVIAIIGILIGIVSTATIGAVRNGRAKRAEAMCSVLNQAIASYYAQKGEWPAAIEKYAKDMGEKETVTLTQDDADQVFREIVKASVGAGATMRLVDAHALFVIDSSKLKNSGEGCYDNHDDETYDSYCGNKGCANGIDFAMATRAGSKKKIPLSNMAFGYQSTKQGKFSRFWIVYNGRTDSVTVSRRNPDKKYPEDWE